MWKDSEYFKNKGGESEWCDQGNWLHQCECLNWDYRLWIEIEKQFKNCTGTLLTSQYLVLLPAVIMVKVIKGHWKERNDCPASVTCLAWVYFITGNKQIYRKSFLINCSFYSILWTRRATFLCCVLPASVWHRDPWHWSGDGRQDFNWHLFWRHYHIVSHLFWVVFLEVKFVILNIIG